MFAIAFTGQDGTGKSTQMELLRRQLVARGLRVSVVHQYGPTTWLGKTVAPIAKKTANRLMRRSRTEKQTPGRVRPTGGWVRLLAAWMSLALGWSRTVTNWFRNRGADILILDRYFSDEVVRAAHKFGAISRGGLWIMRSWVPRPNVVFTFTLDPRIGWERKKTREMTLDEYREKTEIVRATMREAERFWPVVTIAIDDKIPGEISEIIGAALKERCDGTW